jgi:hypothetical protein
MSRENNEAPNQVALMPHLLGQGPQLERGVFGESTRWVVGFQTERDSLTALLPPGFELSGDPVVYFVFIRNEQVNFLAGGDLNILNVFVPTIYRGAREIVEGLYTPVIWENRTMAIILGREVMGAPKLHADMENPVRIDGEWRALASEGGRPLIELRLRDLKPVAGEAFAAIKEMNARAAWLGWKHIPTETGQGVEVSHATYYPFPTEVKEAWMGQGEVTFFETEPSVNQWSHHVLKTLKALPLVDYSPAFMLNGSSQLVVCEGHAL